MPHCARDEAHALPRSVRGLSIEMDVDLTSRMPVRGTPSEHFLDKAVAVAVVPQGIPERTRTLITMATKSAT
jgi:hypothetical protein